jgi:hypothetical protein
LWVPSIIPLVYLIFFLCHAHPSLNTLSVAHLSQPWLVSRTPRGGAPCAAATHAPANGGSPPRSAVAAEHASVSDGTPPLGRTRACHIGAGATELALLQPFFTEQLLPAILTQSSSPPIEPTIRAVLLYRLYPPRCACSLLYPHGV